MSKLFVKKNQPSKTHTGHLTKGTKFMESLKSSSKGGRFQLWTLKIYSQPTCFDTTRTQEGFGFPYPHHTLFFHILI